MVTLTSPRSSTTHGIGAARAALGLLSAAALIYALGAAVFGLTALATQLGGGTIQPTMYWGTDATSFTAQGNPGSSVHLAGAGGSTVVTVTGASTTTVFLYALSAIAAVLAQVVLGLLALRVLGRLRTRAPFQRAAWREAATLSALVLGLGIAAQLLGWWTRIAVIADGKDLTQFSRGFNLEPLTIALGLSLALLAVAFRYGARAQAETEGLI